MSVVEPPLSVFLPKNVFQRAESWWFSYSVANGSAIDLPSIRLAPTRAALCWLPAERRLVYCPRSSPIPLGGGKYRPPFHCRTCVNEPDASKDEKSGALSYIESCRRTDSCNLSRRVVQTHTLRSTRLRLTQYESKTRMRYD